MKTILLNQKFPTNLSTVIAAHTIGNKSVVLVMNKKDDKVAVSFFQPYTIWTVSGSSDSDMTNHYHGQSSNNIVEAAAFFSQRLGREF